MNQQESAIVSGYEASVEEVQKVVKEWATATEAFHRRYAKLSQVINSLHSTVRQQPNPTASRVRLRKLMELRDNMSDTLMTLLLDMSGKKPGHSLQPSKSGQLHSHVSLLDEMNRKIDAELISYTTVAQA